MSKADKIIGGFNADTLDEMSLVEAKVIADAYPESPELEELPVEKYYPVMHAHEMVGG